MAPHANAHLIDMLHRFAGKRLLDGVAEALQILQSAGYQLAGATNQAAVADGRTTDENARRIHERMRRDFEAAGITIGADCSCRKPRPGLLDSIEAQVGTIDRKSSWMVGDKESDTGFGRNIGVRTSLIRSRYWDSDTLTEKPDQIVGSLLEFARSIIPPS